MREDHRFRRKGNMDNDQRRMLPVIIIPLIVIVLMIIIVIADHSGKKEPEPEKSTSQPATETMSPESGGDMEPSGDGETSPEDADSGAQAQPEPELFLPESMPGIQALLERYYRARAEADAEAVNEVYGIRDVSASDLADQKARMGNNAKYISDIRNVATYVVNGKVSGNWLIYSTADIKFYTAKTVAPMIMWCYVKQDLEGHYLIVDNAVLTPDELRFADKTNRSLEVRALASSINNQLKEALASDEDLKEVYGVLHDGSPVWEDETETRPEVVILDGSGETEQALEIEGQVPDAGEAVQETESGEAGEAGGQENGGTEAESSEAGGQETDAGEAGSEG